MELGELLFKPEDFQMTPIPGALFDLGETLFNADYAVDVANRLLRERLGKALNKAILALKSISQQGRLRGYPKAIEWIELEQLTKEAVAEIQLLLGEKI